jgi:cytochrome b561
MRPVSPDATRYDPVTIFFHWTTVILVAEQWLGAQTIDWFPSGGLKTGVRSVHITLGVVLLLVVATRGFWRATQGRRLPPASGGVLDLAAKATHWGLYTLIVAMLAAGLFLAWARGDSIFNLFSIPKFDPGDKGLADQVQEVHATIGYLILGLAGLHAAAALVHRYVWHDGVLARMWPWGEGRA